MGSARYQNDGDPRSSGPGFQVSTHIDLLDTPYKWRLPRLVFVNSMSDLFHENVDIGFIKAVFEVMSETPRHTYQILTKRSKRLRKLGDQLEWPSNVWMGVSVENSRYRFRIDDLRHVPSAIRFISAEPLLGPLGAVNLRGVDWVIAGGESGPRARPMDITWGRDLRDRCIDAGVDFFFKQWGGRTPKAGGRLLDGRIWNDMPQRIAV